MRKQKQSTKQTTPIQLAFNKKSHSISMKAKQEEMFAPYKIQWKTNAINDSNGGFFGTNTQSTTPLAKQPLKSVQNNTGSRVFYQNMKNQLLNIKQDVQKLMMKQKTKDKQLHTVHVNDSHSSRKNSSHNGLALQNSGPGCVRTVSIKNKCQQQKQMSKVQSLYENVNSMLAGKIGEGCLKGQQQNNVGQAGQLRMVNSNSNNNTTKLFFQTSHRVEKDPHMRTKSKSIADHTAITKAIYYTELAPQKDLPTEQHEQPIPSPHSKLPVTPSSSKPKLELNIDLSLFDKGRQQLKMIDNNNNNNNEQSLMIDKLKLEVNQLQKQLSLNIDKLNKQSTHNITLTSQLNQLTTQLSMSHQKNTQLQQSISWHMNEITNLHNHTLEQNNRITFLQMQLQKALAFIRQKQQQNGQLMRTIDEQNNSILELGMVCQQLGKEVKMLKDSQSQSLSNQDKKLKDKLKMKQNQLYIYQQELKQAKLKIKQLKQQLEESSQYNCYHQQQQQQQQQETLLVMNNNQQKLTVNEQEQMIDQAQKLKWEVRQHVKMTDALKVQNDRLKGEIQSIRQLNNQTQQRLNQFVKQNTQLTHRICILQKDSQKAFQQMLNTQGFQNIGQQISQKLSTMVDENYSLKNRISHLQSTLQQVTLKNRSLTQQVSIYQQKVSMQKDCVRRLKIEDWDNLTQERDRLKVEVERVQVRLQETKEFYELEMMRKENCISEMKMQINEMIEQETSNQQEQYHPNVKSVKHIKNLDSLMKGFKQMIDENILMKEEVNLIKQSILQ